MGGATQRRWVISAKRAWRIDFGLLSIALGIAALSYSCSTRRPPSPVPPPSPPLVIPTIPTPDLRTTYQSVLQGDTIEKRREIFRLAYLSFQNKERLAARLFFSRAL